MKYTKVISTLFYSTVAFTSQILDMQNCGTWILKETASKNRGGFFSARQDKSKSAKKIVIALSISSFALFHPV